MATDEESGSKRQYGLDRVLGFSDGVFAFAITLLVLDLVVPQLAKGAPATEVPGLLFQELQSFINYFLSFFIVGVWWNAHHSMFSRIKRSNGTLNWLNLLFLLWISLTPFFTKLLDSYGIIQFTVVLYALEQAAAGGFLTLTWSYASTHQLEDKGLSESEKRRILTRVSIPPAVFLLSIGVSFVSPTAATFSWLLMIPPLFIVHRPRGKK